jgi:phthalate 4,5-dioxygenase
MLSLEDNRLLTRVGPGTPMGDLFRRFWLPALLTEELPGPDCVPVRLRLLGEDLIAFRDTEGRVGVFDAFCPHRNAPLFFGRNEESGLRCVYHGWKFDVSGACVDMPNCEEGDSFKDKVNISAYPVYEGGNMVWVYMGPRDKQPPYPAFEWLEYPDSHRYVFKYFMDCNYLQTLENEFDPSHSSFLHTTLDGNASNPFNRITKNAGPPPPRNRKPHIEAVDTDYGAAMIRRWRDEAGEEQTALVAPFMMPCFSNAGALNAPGVFSMNLKVPVDDENSVFFRMRWSRSPLAPDVLNEMKHGNYEFPAVMPGTYRTHENKANDYLIDRNKQRFFTFTGISNTPVQDFAMVENQRGPLADRSREVLVSSDKYIIHVRKRLLNAARALAEGIEPAEPWRPEAYRQAQAQRPPVSVAAATSE